MRSEKEVIRVDINASLIVQMLVFIVFIGLTMKFIWPPMIKALETRRKNIADGLAAAEKGHKELKLAEIKVKEALAEAKAQAAQIIEQANQRANHIIETAKNKAREEGAQLLQLAKMILNRNTMRQRRNCLSRYPRSPWQARKKFCNVK